jgi:hypothetical protein
MEFNATMILAHLVGDYLLQNDSMASLKGKHTLMAAWHALVYTLAIAAFSWTSVKSGDLVTWGVQLGVVFVTHLIIDRWGLAGKWMRSRWVGQRQFADKMGPWSVIIVDNTWHLLILLAVTVLNSPPPPPG